MSYDKVKLEAIESCYTAMQLFLRDLYLEYTNDYLSYASISEHKGTSLGTMAAMIEEGRVVHNDIAEQFKQT